jgi:hypothetical protein
MTSPVPARASFCSVIRPWESTTTCPPCAGAVSVGWLGKVIASQLTVSPGCTSNFCTRRGVRSKVLAGPVMVIWKPSASSLTSFHE